MLKAIEARLAVIVWRAAPSMIAIAAAVRHIEGALAPVSFVSHLFYEKCSCPDESRCAIRSVMKKSERKRSERLLCRLLNA